MEGGHDVPRRIMHRAVKPSGAPVPGSSQRNEKKDVLVWIPKRCEAEGCNARENLRKCSRCTCVMYCSTECQKSDWPRHKKECKHIARLGLWGCPFTDEQMLARQPLGTAGVADAPARDGPRECGICGRTSPLKRTACCGEWVCDRDDEYELMSYSREFCHRSHERYTICGTHHSDRNHRGDQDWRTCGVCEADFAGQIPGTRLWYSTNGYNFVPGLEAQYPKGSFITTECCECRRRLYLGTESYSAKAGNGVFLYSCDACSFR